MVVKNCLNALAKIASTFNLLWRNSSCPCCSRWRVREYDSAGSFPPAVAVVKQRTREKVMENQAAGLNKALGKRDPAIADAQCREVVKRLLLLPETAGKVQLQSVLAALFVITFALEARGATARGLVWSDLAVRQFEAMFSASGEALDVLCTYITATKTKEGGLFSIGALPHVDPWLCPFGAAADALVALCHGPGQDTSVPPSPLEPVSKPTDEGLRARGVNPEHYREAVNVYG